MRHSRVMRVMASGLSVMLLALCGFAVWLWNWKSPPPDPRLFNPVKIPLQQAIKNTTVIQNYPDLTDDSIRFVKPNKPPRLSYEEMITILYRGMNEHWYPGNVQMFYAKVLGGPANAKTVWVVENHMFFSHSVPVNPYSQSIWDWHAWAGRIVTLRHASKAKTATSYIFMDANTGKFSGADSTESF